MPMSESARLKAASEYAKALWLLLGEIYRCPSWLDWDGWLDWWTRSAALFLVLPGMEGRVGGVPLYMEELVPMHIIFLYAVISGYVRSRTIRRYRYLSDFPMGEDMS